MSDWCHMRGLSSKLDIMFKNDNLILSRKTLRMKVKIMIWNTLFLMIRDIMKTNLYLTYSVGKTLVVPYSLLNLLKIYWSILQLTQWNRIPVVTTSDLFP